MGLNVFKSHAISIRKELKMELVRGALIFRFKMRMRLFVNFPHARGVGKYFLMENARFVENTRMWMNQGLNVS